MICWKCGRQAPDGYAFCPGCGERLSGPDGAGRPGQTSSSVAAAAPAPQPGPNSAAGGKVCPGRPLPRWGKKGVILAAAVLVALAVGIAVALGVSGGGKQATSFLYVTDEGELMYVENAGGRAEPILVDDGVAYEEIGENPVDYLFSMDSLDIYRGTFGLTPDAKRIYYIGDNGTLYTITVGALKKGESPERVARDIFMDSPGFMQILDNGGVVYCRNVDGAIKQYLYDGTESRFLCAGLGFVDADQTYVCSQEYTNEYYTEFSYYRTALDGENETECVVEDVHDIYIIEGSIVLYATKDSDRETNRLTVYSVVPGRQPVVLADGVSDVYGAAVDNNGRVTFYYTVETDPLTWSPYDCFSDEFFSMLTADMDEIYIDDYMAEISTDMFGARIGTLCYFDGREARTVAEDVCLEPTDYGTGYAVTVGDTFASAIDGRFISHISSAYMLAYGYEDAIFYRKIDRNPELFNDIDNVTLESAEEYFEDEYGVVSYAANHFIPEQWYQNIDGVEYALDLGGYEPQLDSEEMHISRWWPCLMNERELVLMCKKDEEFKLVSYRLGKNGFEFDRVIFESYDEFYYGVVEIYEEREALYIVSDRYTDDNYATWSDWSIYSDGRLRTVAKEVIPLTEFSDKGDNEYMITYLTYENGENRLPPFCFDIAVTSNGRNVVTFEDLTQIKVLNDNAVLYISDDDLYLWNGRESSRVARGVDRIMLCGD